MLDEFRGWRGGGGAEGKQSKPARCRPAAGAMAPWALELGGPLDCQATGR